MNDRSQHLKLVAPHYSVAIYKGFIRYLEAKFGKETSREIVESTGISLEFFSDDTNFVSEDFAELFYDTLDKVPGIDPDYSYLAAKMAFSPEAIGTLLTYLVKMVTPRYIYGEAISIAKKFNKVDDLTVTSFSHQHLTLNFQSRRETKHLSKVIENWVGSLEAIPTLFSLPPAKVTTKATRSSVTFDVSWISESKLFLLRRFEMGMSLGTVLSLAGLALCLFVAPQLRDIFFSTAIGCLFCRCMATQAIKNKELLYAKSSAKDIAKFIEDSNVKNEQLYSTMSRLDKRYKEANLLAKVIFRLNEVKDVHELLHTTVREIKNTLDYDRVFFMRFNRAKNTLETEVSQGFKTNIKNLVEAYVIDLNQETSEKSHFGSIFKNKEKMLIPVTKFYLETLSEEGKLMIRLTGSTSFLACTVATNGQSYGLLIVDYTNPLKSLDLDDLHIVQNLANQLAICFSNLQALEKEKTLRREFQKYVPAKVIQSISNSSDSNAPDDLRKGVSRNVTVLFSDIRNSTERSMVLPPTVFVDAMNYYFNAMSQIVYAHHGIVDKFIGDAVLAIFNAFGENKDHALLAVQTAFEMQRVIGRVNQYIRENIVRSGTWIDFRVGIGIHSGNAILGNIGSDYKNDFTAMGDTINVASRVEAMCKNFGDSIILISDDVQSQVSGNYTLKSIGLQNIRGTDTKREIFEVVSESLNFTQVA